MNKHKGSKPAHRHYTSELVGTMVHLPHASGNKENGCHKNSGQLAKAGRNDTSVSPGGKARSCLLPHKGLKNQNKKDFGDFQGNLRTCLALYHTKSNKHMMDKRHEITQEFKSKRQLVGCQKFRTDVHKAADKSPRHERFDQASDVHLLNKRDQDRVLIHHDDKAHGEKSKKRQKIFQNNSAKRITRTPVQGRPDNSLMGDDLCFAQVLSQDSPHLKAPHQQSSPMRAQTEHIIIDDQTQQTKRADFVHEHALCTPQETTQGVLHDWWRYRVHSADDMVDMRLDRWVRHLWGSMPYSSLQKAIRRGWLRVNDRKAQGCYQRLAAGDWVAVQRTWAGQFQLRLPSGTDQPGASSHWDIRRSIPMEEKIPEKTNSGGTYWHRKVNTWLLCQDDQIVAINKPAGMACQGGSGQNVHLDRLLPAVLNTPLRLVHRLDIHTSGVFVMAKTLRAAQEISQALRQRHVHKTYWAVVHGHLSCERGIVDVPLQRRGPLMYPVVNIQDHEGTAPLPSWTQYRVMRAFQHEGQAFCLVALHPKTGRMHQLRAHMAWLGHPIVGDGAYGMPLASGMLLHCHRLAFACTGTKYDIVAPAPASFQSFLGST